MQKQTELCAGDMVHLNSSLLPPLSQECTTAVSKPSFVPAFPATRSSNLKKRNFQKWQT
jgi:hypothetical protein